MAIRYEEDIAYFEDVCAVEEAEEFVNWIQKREEPKVDLKKLEHMHTALLQSLLFFRPKILNYPEDDFWKDILW